MQLRTEELPDNVTRAVLSGRLDIDGASKIDVQMNVLAGAKRALVVDLADVSFMASMGLRTLMTCARAISSKGGRIALAAPQENVARVLETSGAADLMGVYPTLDAAVAHVRGA
ncbi:MAG: STAS domain-containing protein [Hyphomonadaceae bacterium]|nr:STAS domain-containing protein [Hyphomonadaceae bacterium]